MCPPLQRLPDLLDLPTHADAFDPPSTPFKVCRQCPIAPKVGRDIRDEYSAGRDGVGEVESESLAGLDEATEITVEE